VQAPIFDLRRYSIHDGPGIRTTVFFKGCPLRCAWCHNPESQRPAPELSLHPHLCADCGACGEACPHGAIPAGAGCAVDRGRCRACSACVETCYAEARRMAGRSISGSALVEALQADRLFYAQSGGGVTFSGGEPLLYAAFLRPVLEACRSQGLHTALDTCGYARWEAIEAVRPFVDLFLYDLKLIDDERHRQATGASNRRILDNLRRLARLGHAIILRYPLVSGINADEASLHAAGRFAASLPPLLRFDLLPYHPTAQGKYASLGRPYPLPGVLAPEPAQVEAAAALLAGYGLPVKIGG
jgi:pyruvate formate lyase activating enzyme